MSKTLALLKHFNEQKKQETIQQKVTATSAIRAKTVSFWVVSVIIIIMLVLLFVFDQKLLSMIKENTAENYTVNEKLAKIEDILKDHGRQASVNNDVMKKLSNILDSLDIRMKNAEDKISQLEQTTGEKFTQLNESTAAQLASIQTLTKEKNSLVDKISTLETEIEKIKSENAPRSDVNTTTATSLIE